jgi:hypothetical protein
LKDHRQATAEANTLAEQKDVPAAMLYHLARVYALSATAAHGDASQVGQYASQAIKLLGMARAARLFLNPANVEDLKTAPDFDSLRARDDFQKLLSELEEQAKTSVK